MFQQYIKTTLFLLSLYAFTIPIKGQQSNTNYFMDWVPQSNELNPARQHPCKLYLGFPGLSPLHGTFENSGFDYNSIFKLVEKDSVGMFLHPDATGDQAFLSSMRKVNYFSAELSTNLASIGFRANDYFFTFEIKDKAFARMTYPRDLFELILDGPEEGKTYDFKNFGFDARYYREYSLGISQKIDKEWTFGVRTKLLFGKAAVRTENNMKFNSELWQWTIPKSGINVYTSQPFQQFYSDSLGNYSDSTVENEDIDFIKDVVFLSKNFGAAIDFGAIFTPNDQWEFSASIIDLGSISWKVNTTNLSQEDEVTFNGFELTPEDLNDTSGGGSGIVDAFGDSMTLKMSNEGFTTGLPANIYLGARYFVNENLSLGVLNRYEFYRGRIRPQLTLSANLGYKFMSTSISYSMMHNSYNNLGVGINFKTGPFNLYVITDNLPYAFNKVMLDKNGEAGMLGDLGNPYGSILMPYRYKTVSFRFGLNLMFGCKDPRKDKPLIQ